MINIMTKGEVGFIVIITCHVCGYAPARRHIHLWWTSEPSFPGLTAVTWDYCCHNISRNDVWSLPHVSVCSHIIHIRLIKALIACFYTSNRLIRSPLWSKSICDSLFIEDTGETRQTIYFCTDFAAQYYNPIAWNGSMAEIDLLYVF